MGSRENKCESCGARTLVDRPQNHPGRRCTVSSFKYDDSLNFENELFTLGDGMYENILREGSYRK